VVFSGASQCRPPKASCIKIAKLYEESQVEKGRDKCVRDPTTGSTAFETAEPVVQLAEDRYVGVARAGAAFENFQKVYSIKRRYV
jgi:hypothetical protein